MAVPVIGFLQGLRTEMETTRQAAADLATSMRAAADQVRESTTQAREAVTTGAAEIRRETEGLSGYLEQVAAQAATKFDDLAFAAKDAGNIWGQELQLAIQAVEAGAMELRDFVRQYGDFRLQIGDELTSIKDYLDGMDFRVFENRFQEMIGSLRDGSATLDQIMQQLGQSQNQFVEQLLQIIEKFRQGKVTLEMVEDAVKQLKKLYPDSDLAELGDELLDELRHNAANKGGKL